MLFSKYSFFFIGSSLAGLTSLFPGLSHQSHTLFLTPSSSFYSSVANTISKPILTKEREQCIKTIVDLNTHPGSAGDIKVVSSQNACDRIKRRIGSELKASDIFSSGNAFGQHPVFLQGVTQDL